VVPRNQAGDVTIPRELLERARVLRAVVEQQTAETERLTLIAFTDTHEEAQEGRRRSLY
jgi:hypothetical protein